MKSRILFSSISLGLLCLAGCVNELRADITVRLSVKYILTPTGTRPADGDIGTAVGFDKEITRGNSILAATGRGYRLQVVEYLDIQPPVPPGEASDYWLDLDARANRSTFEDAALADRTTWRWNANALNIYVNDSSSGQCSFVGDGSSISLGKDISTGTVLHEIGHFFNLRHTHTGDPDCDTFVPAMPLSGNLGDGDGLDATIRDHPCFTRNQLGMANFGANWNPSDVEQQAAVDTSYLNVMSYHLENEFLDEQMDILTDAANRLRQGVVSGRTWFVSTSGGCLVPDGNLNCTFHPLPGNRGGPFSTVAGGVSAADSSGNDLVLIRPGAYDERFTITKAVTLRATRKGSVTIGQ
jgi:hypothetical protein